MWRAASLLGMMLFTGFTAAAQTTIGSGDMPQAMLDIVGSYSSDTEKGKAFRLDDGNQAPGKLLTAKDNGIGSWQYYARSVHEGNRLEADTTWLKRQPLGNTYTGLNVEVPAGRSIVKIGQIIRNKTNYNGYVAYLISTSPTDGAAKVGITNFPVWASYNMQAKSMSADQVEFDINNTNSEPTTIYIWACINGLKGIPGSVVPDVEAIDAAKSFGIVNAAGENFIAVYY
jgi:hypothetical protein